MNKIFYKNYDKEKFNKKILIESQIIRENFTMELVIISIA